MRKTVLLFVFYLLGFTFASADTLGQSVLFNTDPQYEYLGQKQTSAALRKVSEKAYWYISDDYWAGVSEPERNLFLSRLDELALEFDTRIYPVETGFWGSEWNPGIDGDSKITVLITRLIDQAGGYYDTSHEYTKAQIPESNQREMVFISTSSLINGRAKIFLAHEFQHLISFYQKEKLRNMAEDIWLNEARSEYSVKLLGYDDNFETSNLKRRLSAFTQNPSEPLAEWKNMAADYGAITLFSYYLTGHYGEKILVDSLKSAKTGIDSIDEALRLNGFTETFSDIFTNWAITNILNDASINPRLAYKSDYLKSFKISKTQNYGVSGLGLNLSLSNSVRDWQPVWYEFNTPIGYEGNLKIGFEGSAVSKFIVPYIAFHINGVKDIGFINLGSTGSPQASGNAGTLFIKDFSSEIYKVVVIPANQSKTSDFSQDDPASTFNLLVQIVSEVPENQSIFLLLDQIAALQEQIAQLQDRQKSPVLAQIPLSRDLSAGSSGEDVRWLQNFLIKEGVYPEARITGYFGNLTKNAAIRFQKKYGISPQIGYVGFKTRNRIQELVK